MPKPKPDNIIRHEIVLGRADRELLDTAVTASSATRVLTPVVALVSAVSAVTTLLFVLDARGFLAMLPPDLRATREFVCRHTLTQSEAS